MYSFFFFDNGEGYKAREMEGELVANRLFSPLLLENKARSAALVFSLQRST